MTEEVFFSKFVHLTKNFEKKKLERVAQLFKAAIDY